MNHLDPEDRKYLEQKAFRTAGSRGQKVFMTAELFIEVFQFFFSILMTFSSVQWLSHVRLFVTPWITACQASLSISKSQSSLRLMFIELVMPSSHLILCRPLLLLPPIPPSIRALFLVSHYCQKLCFTWIQSSSNYWDLFCSLTCVLFWRMFHMHFKRMHTLLFWMECSIYIY